MAGFQLRIGIVHFLVAAWIARYTTFIADSSVGNTLSCKRQVTAACDFSPGIASLELRLI